MLLGTSGWGLFVTLPWMHVDMTDATRGVFVPWRPDGSGVPQGQRNQHDQLGKGTPPLTHAVPGLVDLFVFDAREPTLALRDFSLITGPAALPPKWALGYMQSHRTLQDEHEMLDVIRTFREKRIPLDAAIYLGTGFTPRGWNTRQPSFDFNRDIFLREPREVLADMRAHDVKVIVHIVPWDRDRLPTLHGSIPPRPGETLDAGHLWNYWQQHVELVRTGIDGFWPDEGDWFDLYERLNRHRLYYQGMLSVRPDERPWHLQRNGYPGIAQWGGWIWSGDTDSSWKTLEAQIAVALNYGLSVGPYWGSDIGGFYPSSELTGELYARWHQFAAFSGSFRAHGRTWHMRLPWGWGLSEFGPQEVNNTNTIATPADERRLILASELNNPAIEPIAKRYTELRYQLLPYTYTLSWEARSSGLPLMRALWLHYPDDARASAIGDQYLWGRDMLVAPVYEKGAAARSLYLPAGDWYDWWTNERMAGGRTISRTVDLATLPLYVRAGAIIPVDPVRQFALEPVSEPTTLRVYRGADGDFTLYDDDGTSQEYLRNRGSWTRIRWDDAGRTLTLEAAPPDGATNTAAPRTFRVMLMPDGVVREVRFEGKRITVRL
jgi:alpha-glucosidase/alpha-D-xyloside xylohydrolase